MEADILLDSHIAKSWLPDLLKYVHSLDISIAGGVFSLSVLAGLGLSYITGL
jgi:hypothetical protein